jgi:hypothetical protein
MAALVAAAPALRSLSLCLGGAWFTGELIGTELQPLSALASCLTYLDIYRQGWGIDRDAYQLHNQHMQSLAGLRVLSHLAVRGVGGLVTDVGILALADLTALTHLVLDGMHGSCEKRVSRELLLGLKHPSLQLSGPKT